MPLGIDETQALVYADEGVHTWLLRVGLNGSLALGTAWANLPSGSRAGRRFSRSDLFMLRFRFNLCRWRSGRNWLAADLIPAYPLGKPFFYRRLAWPMKGHKKSKSGVTETAGQHFSILRLYF